MPAEAKTGYGLLMYRIRNGALEVLLVHPGGPFWRNRDAGAWTIPKGGANESDADPLDAAVREFQEETGAAPHEPFISLSSIKQKAGKVVHAWACEARDLPEKFSSSAFEMEWPPKSGAMRAFPEIDRWGFFPLAEARKKIIASQQPFLERLEKILQGTQ